MTVRMLPSMLRSFSSATWRAPSKLTTQIVAKDALDIQKNLKDEQFSKLEALNKFKEPAVQDPSIIIGGSVGGMEDWDPVDEHIRKKLRDERFSKLEALNKIKFKEPSIHDPSTIIGGSVGGMEDTIQDPVDEHKISSMGLTYLRAPKFLKPANVVDDIYYDPMLADDYRKSQYRKHLEGQKSQFVGQDPILPDNIDTSEFKTSAKSASKDDSLEEEEDVQASEIQADVRMKM
jgi:glutaredoxin